MKTRSRSAQETTSAHKSLPGVSHSNSNSKAKKKKKQSQSQSLKDDPHKPKKPPTAFFFYLEDFRRTFQQENPSVKSMREIGKACGDKWKTLSFEVCLFLVLSFNSIATVFVCEIQCILAEHLISNGSVQTQNRRSYCY
ncbi:hypothetical protein LUZ61_008069 [Rhynchospora tenuis]|uniref:HMG box domain-containing protein n=1 Tax=Rhynchospora tenuis TaxID=198213 RepID=A0AAD6EX56_9POAL|nr:hypothetical protein LUZ61_008069 [Rhynchospora tenuis]